MDHTTNRWKIGQSVLNQVLNFLPVADIAAADHDIDTGSSQRLDLRDSLTSQRATAGEQHKMSRAFLHHPLGHLSTETTYAADQDVCAILPQELDVSLDTWCLGSVSRAQTMCGTIPTYRDDIVASKNYNTPFSHSC